MLHFVPSFVCLLAVLCLQALPGTAQAHAVHSQRLDTVLPVVLQLTYSTGDVARYTNIEVFSPENRTLEYQNGRTDQQGRFSFTPDKEGDWLVVMQDNMGHKLEIPVQVQHLTPNAPAALTSNAAPDKAGATFAMAVQPSAQASPNTAFKALLGLSVLLNILTGWYWYKKRREVRAH